MAGLDVNDPIDLGSLVLSNAVIPGDVIKLRAGTYARDWVFNWQGTSDNPVTVMPYNNENVILDGSLWLGGSYLIIKDIEIRDTNPDRTVHTSGITMNNPGCKLIGCDIHDMRHSGIIWQGSGVGVVAECIIRGNGIDTQLDHALYGHNHLGGTRLIARNMTFAQSGKYSLHLYSGGANYIKDYIVEDNVFCGDPVHTGGGLGVVDFVYRGNVQYGNYCQHGRYSGSNQNQNGQIVDNTLIDVFSYSVNADCDLEWLNLLESGNIVYGGEPANRAGYTKLPKPAVWSKFTPFSLSGRWLGGLAIFNRDGQDTCPIDFPILSHGAYLLRNVQNPAETWSFVYAGAAINVPMNIWTAAERMTFGTPPPFYPFFGMFVVEYNP